MIRVLALLAVLLLAACAGSPKKSSPPAASSSSSSSSGSDGLYAPHIRDGAPDVPPDVARIPDPVPRAEPRARYGNRSPYTVLGKTYHVMTSERGYRERGIASWYGTKFHGRPTSSFEPYDMYKMTAAHKTLPLPSYVRVTNLDNGRSITVRVNDRGPFHDGRIIDLSYAAAIKLGIHRTGTARVEVEAIDVGAPEPAAVQTVTASSATLPAGSGRVYVQVGSFGEKDNARRLADRLEEADLEPVDLQRARVGGDRVYRVRIGPVERSRAIALVDRVRALGLGNPTLTGE